jgi:acetyl-CoA C-acetyltransferase
MKDDIVIVGAVRTPVGAFNGAFASLPAHDLGKVAIKAAIDRAGVEPARVSEVILGQILQAGQGQGPARQASINAGIPVEVPAWSVNQLCGSGLRAVALGYQGIVNGDSEIAVVGGQESMSMAPHCAHLRSGVKMGNFEMVDTMIKDGLWDAFNGYHMGTTAENVAKKWQITRAQQDEFAVGSQNKAEAAQKAGKFKDEIAPVTVPSLSKAGRSLLTASSVVPCLGYSSASTSMSPLRVLMVTGTISSLKRPDFCAASALFCDPAAKASCSTRVIWYFCATFSAVLPMW